MSKGKELRQGETVTKTYSLVRNWSFSDLIFLIYSVKGMVRAVGTSDEQGVHNGKGNSNDKW